MIRFTLSLRFWPGPERKSRMGSENRRCLLEVWCPVLYLDSIDCERDEPAYSFPSGPTVADRSCSQAAGQPPTGFGLTVMEWQRHFFPREPMPWLLTILTLGLALFTAVWVWRIQQRMEGWKLGRDGERADGYQVLHDVLGEGFNLDHALIGPGGVFTVETKTWSKPAKGSPEVLFDGEAIRVGGLEPDRNPVIQARAQAGWLRSVLSESTGREFAVLPVVVFPGWFVKTTTRPRQPLWVLEPKALVKYLKNREPQLTADEIALAGFHLSRFVRAEEARRARNGR